MDPDPTAWTRVIAAADLVPGKPARVPAGDDDVFVLQLGERIFALSNRCTHQGGPLHRGRVNPAGSEPTITCPVHGSMFWMSDGRVVRGPATVPQPVFDVRVEEGWVEVRRRRLEG